MRSGELYPGDRLQHADGKVVTLSRRKRPGDGQSTTPFFPGWWLTDGGGHLVKPCTNCGWQQVRATTQLCVPCWRYQRRTGQPRPIHIILAHLERTVERSLATR